MKRWIDTKVPVEFGRNCECEHDELIEKWEIPQSLLGRKHRWSAISNIRSMSTDYEQ